MDANVLFLEDVPEAPRLALLIGTTASRADSPLQAAWALASGSTDVIVVGAEARWAHDLLASLPPAKRPAVVGVGDETPALYGLVDRWLNPSASTAQVASCFATALGRARQRTESGEHLMLDPETGLPSREALLGAVVRRAERASREQGELSVVVVQVHVHGDFQRAAALVAARTRRNETTARAGFDQTATLIHGGLRIAERVRARFEAQLHQAGLAARARCRQLALAEAPAALLRALEAVAAADA